MEMNRINVGDSALSGVWDSLNRIQELGVHKRLMALSSSLNVKLFNEIDHIKEGISDSLALMVNLMHRIYLAQLKINLEK
ncbi:hypothetical protein AN396_04015 [Candidatus Epulonipiscium fishelsonii]|uniref:Uncharacterized protein n=1 Tax=Candidatus Epulonipiscium fishelsonii TaxID=77094 RepID=A0ACC8XDZ3_9FIRM|nr:hypothetical protein AN396_04015 [Epulopiscium sp. SCG-B11WGA-EpuloA1]